MLTKAEATRYSRHLLLPEIGSSGQEKLKNAKVLVIGAGGLGCPVLMYLAAAGIGHLGLIDFDTVDDSNLQRQVLFDTEDVGRPKAVVARKKLSRQNPHIRVDGFNEKLGVNNALELFSQYDIVVDGTDNFSTRYLVNDACVLTGRMLVSGSIFKFQGQVSVFNYESKHGEPGPTYRCLFPSPPAAGSVPSCSEVGVLGVLPGLVGSLMANEVIKMITGVGAILSGKLLLIDSLAVSFHTVEIMRNPAAVDKAPQDAGAFKKMDYDLFCGINAGSVREISAKELQALLLSSEDVQLLDVREPDEQPVVPALNALKIPLGLIGAQADRIPRNRKVVVICRSGGRSTKAIQKLSGELGFQNLYNLTGGVLEWIKAFN